jgi:hypothetical protein
MKVTLLGKIHRHFYPSSSCFATTWKKKGMYLWNQQESQEAFATGWSLIQKSTTECVWCSQGPVRSCKAMNDDDDGGGDDYY